MLENIYIESKNELIGLVDSIIDDTIPLVSNLSNLSRLIMMTFPNTSWCGFYLSNEIKDTLYLGPYQGGLACTTIPFGKGVCGNSALKKTTELVHNVHLYPGHIACSSKTNSEIVVPIIKDNLVYGVIDLDSEDFNNYCLEDQKILEEVACIISKLF